MNAFRFLSSRPIGQQVVLGLILLGVLFSTQAWAQQPGISEIKVPYALSWGDAPEKIHDMIRDIKATELSSSEVASGKLVIEAQGLGIADPLLRKSIFTFRDGSLVEVELQYDSTSWDGDRAVDFFDRTRRRIDERYGAGTLLVNKVRETPADATAPKDAIYTLIIYSWAQPIVTLELNFYSMEEKEHAFRIVSLHYKVP